MNSWLRSATSRLWTSWVIAALAVPTARGQSGKRLWVLQERDQMVEYALVTSAVVRSQTVPRRLVEHPEYLSINAAGQMLFLPSLGAQWAAGDMATSADRAWFWDGSQAKEWKLEGPKRSGTHAGKPTVTETVRQWFLSAGGGALFWIEHTSEQIMDTLRLEHS